MNIHCKIMSYICFVKNDINNEYIESDCVVLRNQFDVEVAHVFLVSSWRKGGLNIYNTEII